jgi:hypothetical protein
VKLCVRETRLSDSPLIDMHPRLNVPRIARYPSEVTGTVQLPVLHVGNVI